MKDKRLKAEAKGKGEFRKTAPNSFHSNEPKPVKSARKEWKKIDLFFRKYAQKTIAEMEVGEMFIDSSDGKKILTVRLK